MTIRSLLEHVGVDVAGKKIFVGDREVDPLMATTRAKFRCSTVEMTSSQPYERKLYQASGGEPISEMTWPRKYRFVAVTDDSTPENQRYAQYTPSGELAIQVDNPAVVFEPGRDYYLDFTPVAP